MDFVDDIDTIGAPEWRELDVFADFPNVVHAGIGGAIDFYHIDRCSLSNLLTVGTGDAGCSRGTFLAVERFRKNSRHRGFPDTARAGKYICVGNALRRDGIDERLYDVRLADHVIERSRSVFSRRDLIIHFQSSYGRLKTTLCLPAHPSAHFPPAQPTDCFAIVSRDALFTRQGRRYLDRR